VLQIATLSFLSGCVKLGSLTRKCSIYQNTKTSKNGMTPSKEDNFYLFSGKNTPKNRKNHHIWGLKLNFN
jgi:hypothetical protein